MGEPGVGTRAGTMCVLGSEMLAAKVATACAWSLATRNRPSPAASYLEEVINVLLRHGVRTCPDKRRFDRLDVEARHQTKVAATTLERPEQVRVAGLVDFDNGAVGQNNLVVDDRVAAPADLVTIEVDAAGQEQTGDTDRRETAAGDSEAVGLEVRVDLAPAGTVS